MVKNPKINLADEPTGNLDANTTDSVLKILKNISKDHLVLTVSHNIVEAHKYADYILELESGNLVGTYKRNEKKESSIDVIDGVLRLPLHKEILDYEKENIIKNNKYKIKDIIQDDRDFKPVLLENPAKVKQKPINKRHISFINAFKRGIKFLRKALTPMFVFSLITASLFALINASYAIKNINAEDTVNYNMKHYKNDYYYFADEEKLDRGSHSTYDKNPVIFDKLQESNYEGKIHKSYVSHFTNANRHAFYLVQQPGNILQVDKKYIEDRFGKIEFVVKAEKEEDFGFYCFDYLLDLKNNFNPSNARDYDSYLGFKFQPGKVVYLNGVIKTDFKTKYKKFLNIIFDRENYLNEITPKLRSIDKKLYEEYINDLNYYLVNLITFNENFIDDYVNHPYNLVTNKRCIITNPETSINFNDKIKFTQTMSFNAISETIYKKITGKSIGDYKGSIYQKIDPIKIKITIYNNDDEKYNTKDYEFVFDHVVSSYAISLNVLKPDVLEFFKENIFNLNGFILDSSANITELKKQGCFDDNYWLQNEVYTSVDISERLRHVFDKVFSVIILGLLLCSIISSAFYGIYIVKKNMRNIGICKSLGARTIDILIILALNLFLAILLTTTFYCGLAEIFMIIIEQIMQRALESSTSYYFPPVYKLLFNNPIMYALNIILIAIISIFSFIALFIKINSLKPIELIKSKK